MKYSVSITAEGDREVSLAEVVELADAVAGLGGIASGAGTLGYGAQIVVEATSSDEAVELGLVAFAECVERAGLPAWPVARAETLGEFEDEDFEEDE
jgi:hypothetical protein